ncbi:uncharacterized protein LTR77_005925 [Saxophila tyrrhenica]|uniref:Uncharacterized protein n=1 Tax=Saxophila tyrrhenica TaxID=1690608 RepID=A0AAV9P6H1_9PEZI|nr:hypothetical protein LTR77_005925 [Saxophila tyrrhenica]
MATDDEGGLTSEFSYVSRKRVSQQTAWAKKPSKSTWLGKLRRTGEIQAYNMAAPHQANGIPSAATIPTLPKTGYGSWPQEAVTPLRRLYKELHALRDDTTRIPKQRKIGPEGTGGGH